MQLLEQLMIGGVMIMITFVFQAICFDFIIKRMPLVERGAIRLFRPIWKSCVFIVIISSICSVMIFEIWMWALFYMTIDVLPDLETALYFSNSAFTTVGFGDVYLGKDWRMISSIEAMNGFLLFGWSTAFIWEMVTHIYHKEGSALERKTR